MDHHNQRTGDMLKAKKCKVEFCEHPVWAKQLCKAHQYMRTDRAPKPLKKTVGKKKYEDLRPFYSTAMAVATGKCFECGENIPSLWRQASIAHILPKSKFPSVASNALNFVELCVSCHTKFDTGFETASKMKCWVYAKARFNKFKDQISEEDLRKVPEQFYE